MDIVVETTYLLCWLLSWLPHHLFKLVSSGSTELWIFHPGQGILKYQFHPGLNTPLTFLGCKRGKILLECKILFFWSFSSLDWLPASCWKSLSRSKSILQVNLKTPASPESLIVPYSNCPFGVWQQLHCRETVPVPSPATADSRQDGTKKILLPSLPHLLFWQLENVNMPFRFCVLTLEIKGGFTID